MAIRFKKARLEHGGSAELCDLVVHGSELSALSDIRLQFINRKSGAHANGGRWVGDTHHYEFPATGEVTNDHLRMPLPDDGLRNLLRKDPSGIAVIVTGTVHLGNVSDSRTSGPLPLDGSDAGSETSHERRRTARGMPARRAVGALAGVLVVAVAIWFGYERQPAPVVEPVVQPPIPATPETPSYDTAMALIARGDSAAGLDLLRSLAATDMRACLQLARLYDPAIGRLEARPPDIVPNMNHAFRWYDECDQHPDAEEALRRLGQWVARRAGNGDPTAIALLPRFQLRLRDGDASNR